MRRWLMRIFLGVAVAVALSIGVTWWMKEQRHADAASEALALMRSDAVVRVDAGDWIHLDPRVGRRDIGVIFYPGAYVDVRGYLPTFRPIAAAGYPVAIVKMPLEMAIFGIDRASQVMTAHPEVSRWVLIGHSVGGAMTGPFARRHPEQLAGVIIYDSYPAMSLAEFPRPVWHVHRARADGTPPPSFAAKRGTYPPDSRWVPIRGGIHMYFGSFEGGGYREDWAPSISRDAQQREVIAATLAALAFMEESTKEKSTKEELTKEAK